MTYKDLITVPKCSIAVIGKFKEYGDVKRQDLNG